MSNVAKVEKFMSDIKKRLGNDYNVIYGKLDHVEVQKLDINKDSVKWKIRVTYEQIFYEIDPVGDTINLCMAQGSYV
jgi:hypothetical protein